MPFILQVALDTPLHRLFDYRLPEQLGPVQPGSLVEVPFGRTLQIGVALGRQSASAVVADTLRDALRAAPQARATLREQKQGRHAAALVAAGWAEWSRLPPAAGHAPPTQAAPAATVEQQAALDRLLPALGPFGVHLIHGVTGSGKTELYLRLIDVVLTTVRQVQELIPEIALTPFLV